MPEPTGDSAGSLPISLRSEPQPDSAASARQDERSADHDGSTLRAALAMMPVSVAAALLVHFVEDDAGLARIELHQDGGGEIGVDDRQALGRGVGLHAGIDLDDAVLGARPGNPRAASASVSYSARFSSSAFMRWSMSACSCFSSSRLQRIAAVAGGVGDVGAEALDLALGPAALLATSCCGCRRLAVPPGRTWRTASSRARRAAGKQHGDETQAASRLRLRRCVFAEKESIIGMAY